MTYGHTRVDQYLIRLERGEDVVEALKSFCQNHAIKNGYFHGVGSIESPTLAHYKVANKKYSEKSFEGSFEVTSLLGNISFFEEEPVIHPHITISDETMQAFGGHLVKGEVSATMEIFLTFVNTRYEKRPDEAIGLKLFELPNWTEK